MRSSGRSPRRSLWGTASPTRCTALSLAVEKRGAVPSMPTCDEIDARAGQ
jgi:hypothetical protein